MGAAADRTIQKSQRHPMDCAKYPPISGPMIGPFCNVSGLVKKCRYAESDRIEDPCSTCLWQSLVLLAGRDRR